LGLVGVTKHETVPRDMPGRRSDDEGTTSGRSAPNKIYERKKTSKIQLNFWQLSTLSEYPRNWTILQKSEMYIINYNLSLIGWKKVGELWSTHKKGRH